MSARWMGCAAALALVAAGCSDGGETRPPGAGGSTSSSSSASVGGSASGGSAAGGGGSGGGTPFSSQGASSYEAQTSLAADAGGAIVVAWVAFFADGSTSIGYASSRDEGANWSAPKYIASPDDRRAANPSLAVDSGGRFALAWLGFRLGGADPDEHVYFSLLDEASDTFSTPTIASDDGSSTTLDFDKPSLTVDAVDDFLVTWADFTATASLTFARTSDGTSFERHSLAADATFGNLAQLCLDRALGPTAPLYVVHLAAGASLGLHRSVDGGVNWSPFSVPAVDALFQDPTCVAQGSDLWIAYASGTGFIPQMDTPADELHLIHSPDGGTTMAAPVVASDISGDSYLYPRLFRTPQGKLALVYYQGLVGQTVQLMVSSSSDGTTFAPAPIAPAGTMTLDTTLANWLGAYVGVANGSSSLLTSYTDNSSVKDHIAFAKFVAP